MAYSHTIVAHEWREQILTSSYDIARHRMQEASSIRPNVYKDVGANAFYSRSLSAFSKGATTLFPI